MVEIVPASPEWWEHIRNLRNNPLVKSGFIEQGFIDKDEHHKFMVFNHDFFGIALDDGIFAGYAGVIDDDIRVCVHPNFQKLGIGKKLINHLTTIWPNAKAKIKIGNVASQKLFESCGFGREEEPFYLYKKS